MYIYIHLFFLILHWPETCCHFGMMTPKPKASFFRVRSRREIATCNLPWYIRLYTSLYIYTHIYIYVYTHRYNPLYLSSISIVSLYLYYTGWWYTYPSEKYEFVSWDDDIPNMWKNKKCSKPPTSIYIYNYIYIIHTIIIRCISVLFPVYLHCLNIILRGPKMGVNLNHPF